MNKFEILVGDASFGVYVNSKSQNQFNTPINSPHFHIDKEIHIVLTGSATMEFNGKDITTKAGDVYIIGQSVSHYYKNISGDFIFERYSENITIEDLALKLYKSVPQTHRIVKSYFNDNFKTVLIKQRMEQACILIKENKKNLNEIAYSCGYNSYNGFLSAFKRYTAKTPEEYRIMTTG